MKLKELKLLYKLFEESICNAHSYISQLIPELSSFLYNYAKSSKYKDLQTYEKLEENLIYLEMFYNNFDEIFEYIENISFNNIELNSDNIVQFKKK